MAYMGPNTRLARCIAIAYRHVRKPTQDLRSPKQERNLKMLKSLIKMFIPNEKKLSTMAAESIAKAINSQTEREAQIAKYAKLAD